MFYIYRIIFYNDTFNGQKNDIVKSSLFYTLFGYQKCFHIFPFEQNSRYGITIAF